MRIRFFFVVGFMLSLVLGAGGVACGWDWTVVPKEAGDGGGETGGKEGGPPGADCDSSADCLADEFCAFDDGKCGGENSGICTINKCSEQSDLVCGCDGVVYEGSCAASKARVDYSLDRCTQPPGPLTRCGVLFCNQKESFCFANAKCVPWGSCTERTCACATQVVGDCPKPVCDNDGGVPTNLRCD